VGMMEAECASARVQIHTSTQVEDVRHDGGFRITAGPAEFRAPALVVATGGLSIVKSGATSFGYDLARQFGISIRECRPGLVPLTLAENDRRAWCDLAGVSAPVVVSCGSESFRESMLITHRGLSGPAILQASSYWRNSEPLLVDLAPGREWITALRHDSGRRNAGAARGALREILPQRLADRWLERHAPEDWTNPSLDALERALHHWSVTPAGTEGYEKAEVTAGGVDTEELSGKTMESRKVPGLFFIGEVVDVTGHLGGFNFQWAWASGYCAGVALSGALGRLSEKRAETQA